MSNKTSPITRRTFLKGTAAVSALSLGGISSLALAGKATVTDPLLFDEITCNRILGNGDIKIIQETLFGREKVTLINESGKLQMLDVREPISLYQVDDTLVVTVNQDDKKAVNGMMVMSDGDRLTFDVKAIGIEIADEANLVGVELPALTNIAENQLQISSAHPVFNRTVDVQIV